MEFCGNANPLAPPEGKHFNDSIMLHKFKRLLWVLLVGLGFMAGAAGLLFFRYARPMGSGAAGPAVAREPFATAWSQRPVLLVGLGDSVTAGFGARKGYGYFDRLIKNPADEFPPLSNLCLTAVFPRLMATNLSVSGSTSSEVLARQLSLLPTNSPETLGLVVITTGGNDLIHNYGRTPPREEAMYGATWEEARPWVENFRHRLNTMVAQVEGRFPGGCEIFLANIFDPTDGVGDAERAGLPAWPAASPVLAAYNQVIQDCTTAHPNVHLIDMHGAFLGHGIHCTQFWQKHYNWQDPHYWFFVNLEDPNERGYDVIRRLFLLEMIKVQKRLQ